MVQFCYPDCELQLRRRNRKPDCPVGQLEPPAREQGAGTDEHGIGLDRSELRIDLADGAGVHDLDLHSPIARAAVPASFSVISAALSAGLTSTATPETGTATAFERATGPREVCFAEVKCHLPPFYDDSFARRAGEFSEIESDANR